MTFAEHWDEASGAKVNAPSLTEPKYGTAEYWLAEYRKQRETIAACYKVLGAMEADAQNHDFWYEHRIGGAIRKHARKLKEALEQE